MNILFLSDFYLSDPRLLETLGKTIKASGKFFIIIPDGRRFASEQIHVAPDILYDSEPKLSVSDQTALINLLSGSVSKPLVNFFAEGMLPTIAFAGHQRKLVTLTHSVVKPDLKKISALTGESMTLILLSTADSEGKGVFISPVTLARSFSEGENTVYFLDEILPPDGISTFQEIEIWVRSEKSAEKHWDWIHEWKGAFPVTFMNLAGLREFSKKTDRFLTIGR